MREQPTHQTARRTSMCPAFAPDNPCDGRATRHKSQSRAAASVPPQPCRPLSAVRCLSAVCQLSGTSHHNVRPLQGCVWGYLAMGVALDNGWTQACMRRTCAQHETDCLCPLLQRHKPESARSTLHMSFTETASACATLCYCIAISPRDPIFGPRTLPRALITVRFSRVCCVNTTQEKLKPIET